MSKSHKRRKHPKGFFVIESTVCMKATQDGDFPAHLYHVHLDFVSLMRCKIQVRAFFRNQ